MASGDVALELSATDVAADNSSRENQVATHETRFTISQSTAPAGTYTVVVKRTSSISNPGPLGVEETPFDSTKKYKITITEV